MSRPDFPMATKPKNKPTAAPKKRTASVLIHPNVIEVRKAGAECPEVHNLDHATPADFESNLLAGLQKEGFEVEAARHDHQGKRIKLNPDA